MLGALLSGCYIETEGLVVDLSARVPTEGLTVDETTTLTSDLGVTWGLDDGCLRLAAATLLGCDGDTSPADLAHDAVYLLDVAQDEPLGSFTPPPGAWCGLELVSAPIRQWGADTTPAAWDLTVTEPAGPQRALSSEETLVLSLSLAQPLELDGGHRDAHVVVELPVGRWLDGVPASASDDALKETVHRRLRETSRAELE